MSGRRNTGQAAGLVTGLIVKDRAERQDFQRRYQLAVAEQESKFRQGIVESGIKGEIPGFEANPQAMQSMLSGQRTTQPLVMRSQAQTNGLSQFDPLLENARTLGLEASFDFDAHGRIKGGKLKPPRQIDEDSDMEDIARVFGGTPPQGSPMPLVAPQPSATPAMGGAMGGLMPGPQLPAPVVQPQLSTVPLAGANQDDPIIRTGRDSDTGKRVGLTKSGRVVPLE